MERRKVLPIVKQTPYLKMGMLSGVHLVKRYHNHDTYEYNLGKNEFEKRVCFFFGCDQYTSKYFPKEVGLSPKKYMDNKAFDISNWKSEELLEVLLETDLALDDYYSRLLLGLVGFILFYISGRGC